MTTETQTRNNRTCAVCKRPCSEQATLEFRVRPNPAAFKAYLCPEDANRWIDLIVANPKEFYVNREEVKE